MKTTAKWICGNQFVIDNNKQLRLAVTDHETQENIAPSCMDLMMMGFAGCITGEFRKMARQERIPFEELETEVTIEFIKTRANKMVLTVNLKTVSGAEPILIENCLIGAINSSMPGILFSHAGIPIEHKVIATNQVNNPAYF